MKTKHTSCDVISNDESLKFLWQNGEESIFHYVWLRSCCYCDQCGSTYTDSRYLQPCDVPMDISPQSYTIDNDLLTIVWQPDSHQSVYSLSWLKKATYSGKSGLSRIHKPRLWGEEINQNLPEENYSEVIANKDRYLDLLRKINNYGFVIVRNGPQQLNGIESVANLIGELADSAYSKVFDLKPDPTALTLGNTMKSVPPHTDEAYLHNPTGILVLYCICPTDDGGESILVDGFNLAAQLKTNDPNTFNLLATQPQTFHRVVPDDGVFQRTRAKVITVDENGEVVGFRFHTRTLAPLDVPFNLVKKVHAANSVLSEMMLQKANQAYFNLREGDAVLFDNHRVMHSRRGFSDPKRHLQICNVSRENFHQNFRYAADSLGYCDEANQIFPAGVAG